MSYDLNRESDFWLWFEDLWFPLNDVFHAYSQKENWIGEQCSEIEENLRKNNSKSAYQLVKDFTTVKQGKATTVQGRSGKCLTEEREILNR